MLNNDKNNDKIAWSEKFSAFYGNFIELWILTRWYSRKRFPRASLCCFTHWNIFARRKVFADRRYFRTWKRFHGAKRSTKSHRKRGGNERDSRRRCKSPVAITKRFLFVCVTSRILRIINDYRALVVLFISVQSSPCFKMMNWISVYSLHWQNLN